MFPAFFGPGRLLAGSVERGWGSTRSARSEARTNGVEATRGKAHTCAEPTRAGNQLRVCGVKLCLASMSMSRSTAARGCQAFLRDDEAA